MLTTLLRRLALAAPLALFAGCSGEPPVSDTAEVVRPDPAKPATEPAKTVPVATPTKE